MRNNKRIEFLKSIRVVVTESEKNKQEGQNSDLSKIFDQEDLQRELGKRFTELFGSVDED